MEFKLRPWNMGDLLSLAKYANNEKISSRLTDAFPHPYTEVDAISFISKISDQNPIQVMAIEIDGKASGGIGVHPLKDVFRLNAELGYWLAEPFWGKGIMTAAIRQMLIYGFEKFEIERIFARPYGSNTASQRVLEKVGFVLEAKFEKTLIKNGVLEDELIYSFRREQLPLIT